MIGEARRGVLGHNKEVGRGRQSYAAGQQATKVPPALPNHPAPPNHMSHLPATCHPPPTYRSSLPTGIPSPLAPRSPAAAAAERGWRLLHKT